MSAPPAAARRPRLRVSFSWTLLGNVLYAVCQWGMLSLLAKQGSKAVVGQFVYGQALTAPIFMLAGLQLRGVQATDVNETVPFARYLALRLVGVVGAVGVSIGIAAFTGHLGPDLLVVLGVALAKAIEAVSDIFYGLAQHHERMDLIARSMILRGLAAMIALAAGYRLGGLVAGVFLYAASWAVVLLLHDVRFAARSGSAPISLRPDLAPRGLLALTRVALPLGLVMGLISLNTNLPRYFLEHHAGMDALGVFGALSYLIVAGTTIVNALGQSATPKLAQLHAAGDLAGFRRLTGRLAGLVAGMGLAGVALAALAGRPILTLLYRPDYGGAASELVVIAAAATFAYAASILGYGLTAARSFAIQTPLFAAVTLTTLVSAAVLVPGHGLMGAAMTLVVSAIVQLAGTAAAFLHAARPGMPFAPCPPTADLTGDEP